MPGRRGTAGRRHRPSNYCSEAPLQLSGCQSTADFQSRHTAGRAPGSSAAPPLVAQRWRTPLGTPWWASPLRSLLCTYPSCAASRAGESQPNRSSKPLLLVFSIFCFKNTPVCNASLILGAADSSGTASAISCGHPRVAGIHLLLHWVSSQLARGSPRFGNTSLRARSAAENCICLPESFLCETALAGSSPRPGRRRRASAGGEAGSVPAPTDSAGREGPRGLWLCCAAASHSSLLGRYLSSSQEFSNSLPEAFSRLVLTECLRIPGWERAVEACGIIGSVLIRIYSLTS